jgi:hypothetical protein
MVAMLKPRISLRVLLLLVVLCSILLAYWRVKDYERQDRENNRIIHAITMLKQSKVQLLHTPRPSPSEQAHTIEVLDGEIARWQRLLEANSERK